MVSMFTKPIRGRTTAAREGDAVVLLIGMRINHFWAVHQWLPVMLSMFRMLKELARDPGRGLLGRVLLSLFVDPQSQNYIWRFFCRATDPFVALVAAITPKAAAEVVVWLFGFVWLFWLRVGMLYAFILAGIGPRAG